MGYGCKRNFEGDQVCESHIRTGAGQKSKISISFISSQICIEMQIRNSVILEPKKFGITSTARKQCT